MLDEERLPKLAMFFFMVKLLPFMGKIATEMFSQMLFSAAEKELPMGLEKKSSTRMSFRAKINSNFQTKLGRPEHKIYNYMRN